MPMISIPRVMKLSKLSGFVRHLSAAKPGVLEKNQEILTKILGVPIEGIKKLPRKPINEDSAAAAYTILQGYGFQRGQLLRHLELFMMAPNAIENYVEIMKETLFETIELDMIHNFRDIHKQTLTVLQAKIPLPSNLEIIQNYCKILEISNTKTEDDVWNSLPNDVSRLTLSDLRKQVVLHYLTFRLDAEPVQQLKCYELYPRTSYRCLKWIKECMNLLLDVLDFPKDKILKHGYLIHGNPASMAKIVNEIPSLSGCPLKKLILARPKILVSSSSTLLEIERLFCEHEIPESSITKYPEVYTLSAATIKQRLEELDEVPEFRPLKRHRRVARLLYYQNKAKLRVEQIRSQQLPNASLHFLSADTKRYKKLISFGEVKTKGADIIITISKYFDDVKDSDIRKNLMRQPHWLHSSLVSVQESLQFLQSYKLFSKEQLQSALPIVLYPKEKIEKEFENIVASGEAKMTDEFFLHMALYFLERPVHFSGDGLWNTRPSLNLDDDEEENANPSHHEPDMNVNEDNAEKTTDRMV